MLSRRRRSALLVDFDNIVRPFGGRVSSAIGNWLTWLEDGGFDPAGVKRKFLFKRVYWNVDNDSAHRHAFQKHQIETRLCRAVRNKDKGSSADFDITIDAVELRHAKEKIDEVIILSFDSDFLTVLNHVQAKGMDVVGMAKGADRPAQAYRQLANLVIEHEAFLAALSYERPQRGWFGLPRAAKAKIETKPKPNPAPGPRAAASPTPAAPIAPASGPAARGGYDLKGAAAVLAQAASTQPTAGISKRFAAHALERFPGFRAAGTMPWLGCRNFYDMARALAPLHPHLDVRTDQKGWVYLVYVGPGANGNGDGAG